MAVIWVDASKLAGIALLLKKTDEAVIDLFLVAELLSEFASDKAENVAQQKEIHALARSISEQARIISTNNNQITTAIFSLIANMKAAA